MVQPGKFFLQLDNRDHRDRKEFKVQLVQLEHKVLKDSKAFKVQPDQ
jgi:hypothetical protein